jgi:hypothetical protein
MAPFDGAFHQPPFLALRCRSGAIHSIIREIGEGRTTIASSLGDASGHAGALVEFPNHSE